MRCNASNQASKRSENQLNHSLFLTQFNNRSVPFWVVQVWQDNEVRHECLCSFPIRTSIKLRDRAFRRWLSFEGRQDKTTWKIPPWSIHSVCVCVCVYTCMYILLGVSTRNWACIYYFLKGTIYWANQLLGEWVIVRLITRPTWKMLTEPLPVCHVPSSRRTTGARKLNALSHREINCPRKKGAKEESFPLPFPWPARIKTTPPPLEAISSIINKSSSQSKRLIEKVQRKHPKSKQRKE